MVGHHVPQSARFFVVVAALLDTQILRHGDFHVVDIAAIPDRLKDSVTETKHQNVLNRLLSQIVIDAVDLLFVQNLAEGLIQSSGRIQVTAKRLLDDDAPPMPLFFADETAARRDAAQSDRRSPEPLPCNRNSCPRSMILVNLSQEFLKFVVEVSILNVTRQVVELLDKTIPEFRIDGACGKLLDFLAQLLSEGFAAHLTAGTAHHGELFG